MSTRKFRTICLNRSPAYDDRTFCCSKNGCLVDIQCCYECEDSLLESPAEKIQREININERLIRYHQTQIGDLRLERLKLDKKLEAVKAVD